MSSETVQPEVEPRTIRALIEPMSVLPEMGRAEGTEDQVIVVSSSGKEYLVDIREWSCECADATHRDVRCKHQRLAALSADRLNRDQLEEKLANRAGDLDFRAKRLRLY